MLETLGIAVAAIVLRSNSVSLTDAFNSLRYVYGAAKRER
jgi:hypothetical protein